MFFVNVKLVFPVPADIPAGVYNLVTAVTIFFPDIMRYVNFGKFTKFLVCNDFVSPSELPRPTSDEVGSVASVPE